MEMKWMTMEDIRTQRELGVPVIIPFGTVEQHGGRVSRPGVDGDLAEAPGARAHQLDHLKPPRPAHQECERQEQPRVERLQEIDPERRDERDE